MIFPGRAEIYPDQVHRSCKLDTAFPRRETTIPSPKQTLKYERNNV